MKYFRSFVDFLVTLFCLACLCLVYVCVRAVTVLFYFMARPFLKILVERPMSDTQKPFLLAIAEYPQLTERATKLHYEISELIKSRKISAL